MIIYVNDLCLDYREDYVYFYVYTLSVPNGKRIWRQFALNSGSTKLRRGMVAGTLYNVDKEYLGCDYMRLMYITRRIKAGRSIPLIPIYMVDGKMYPTEGAKRLAAYIYLGVKKINICKSPPDQIGGWNRDYTINSRIFKNTPLYIKNNFLHWKEKYMKREKESQAILLQEIENLQPEKGHYRCYQGLEEIGLIGRRPTEQRYEIYGLENYINLDSVVLELGSNMGCFSVYLSRRVKEVHGVENNQCHIDTANLIKSYLGTKNCFFYNENILNFKSTLKFDLILSLAVHPKSLKSFAALVKKVYTPLLKRNGVILFESRNFNRGDYNHIKCMEDDGFRVISHKICQCKNEEGRLNERRDFYYLKRG